MQRKFQEVYCFTHKKIDIYVKIDFYNNKISLVNPESNHQGFGPKKWLFNDRGVEYMQGWLDILEAMKLAVIDAKKRYEHELAETSKFQEEELIGDILMLQKLENKRSKNVKKS